MTLILFILVCEVVGLLASFYTREALGTWYAKLKKPSFNPPAWLFGPVWVLLYALMGIGAKLIQYALADIVMLFMMIILMMLWFYAISPLASLLLLPYLAWVGFAAVLNYSIWKLNKK